MYSIARNRLTGLVQKHLAVRCVILIALAGGVAVACAPLAVANAGKPGVAAELTALLVCVAAATASLVVQSIPVDPALAVARTLLGMSIRIAPPLATAVVVQMSGGALERGGFLVWLLLFYLLCLAVEVPLALMGMPAFGQAR